MLDLRKFYSYDITVSTSLSIFANALLLFLILYKSPKNLKPYGRILLLTCLFDTCLACITFIIRLQVGLVNGVFVMLMSGSLANVPHPINFLLIMLFLFVLYFTIIALPIPFYYRYSIICKETVLSNFRLACLYLIAAMSTLSLIIFDGLVFIPHDQKLSQYLPIMNNSFWVDEIGQVPIFVATDITNPIFLGMVFYLGILNGTAYMLVLYFIRKIMQKLASMKSIMSIKSQTLQKQINYALIAQAVCPLFTALIPICFVAVTVLLNLNIAEISGIIEMSAIAWITFFNPMIVILVVTPYRRAIFCERSPIDKVKAGYVNGICAHTIIDNRRKEVRLNKSKQTFSRSSNSIVVDDWGRASSNSQAFQPALTEDIVITPLYCFNTSRVDSKFCIK